MRQGEIGFVWRFCAHGREREPLFVNVQVCECVYVCVCVRLYSCMCVHVCVMNMHVCVVMRKSRVLLIYSEAFDDDCLHQRPLFLSACDAVLGRCHQPAHVVAGVLFKWLRLRVPCK